MISAPRARPPMKTDTTMLEAYSVFPNESFMRRAQTTSSIREQRPEEKKSSSTHTMRDLSFTTVSDSGVTYATAVPLIQTSKTVCYTHSCQYVTPASWCP